MSRSPARVTQADIARAARVAASMPGWRVRITADADIIVEQGEPQEQPSQKPLAPAPEYRL